MTVQLVEAIELSARNTQVLYVVAAIAVAALLFAWVLVRQVLATDQGTVKMREIAQAVQEGAAAYLRRQFRTLVVFIALCMVLLYLLPAETNSERIGRSIFFVVGAGFSMLTGYLGMSLAVRGNVRVAAAAKDGTELDAMKIAFRTGGVAGMLTVGLGLLGAAVVVLAYQGEAPKVLEGFGFGAALLAMFMRVGGGIFTKAADVGADLVGKVEQGIPEDDPRNAATIADNVGDNVGDCAGMAADLFESYAVTLVAALILGKATFGELGLVFPLVVPAIGVLTAVIGILAVVPRASDKTGMDAINRGFFLSAVVSAVLVAIASYTMLPATFGELGKGLTGAAAVEFTEKFSAVLELDPRRFALLAVIVGILLAVAIQLLTGYFTETNRKPVDEVAKSAITGPATVILSGISLGLESAVYSAMLIGAAVYAAYLLGAGVAVLSLFAIALAGTGLLTTVGVIVSMDTFGPVSDNAQGIAEMSGDVHGEGAEILTRLDAVGNTTKAITKGIAIATAVLAATALFGSFRDALETAVETYTGVMPDLSEAEVLAYAQGVLDVSNPVNLVGLLAGASVVFMFSGLAINAVAHAASAVIHEVRRQFAAHPGIMEGTEKPEYGKVVDIVTRDSLRELATPGLLAVMTPIAIGFGLGISALGAFLAGTIVTGALMAVFLSNSGGAWDNAKKFVEDGHFGGKYSEAHAATVIGDTVGDPFKDTAGPAINPLIKVMNLVALLIAPAVVTVHLSGNDVLRWGVTAVAVGVVAFRVAVSDLRSHAAEADEITAPLSQEELAELGVVTETVAAAKAPAKKAPAKKAAKSTPAKKTAAKKPTSKK